MRSHTAAKPAGHVGAAPSRVQQGRSGYIAGHPKKGLPQAPYGQRSGKVWPVTDLGLLGETGGSALSPSQAEASEEGRIGRIESSTKKSGSL